MSKYPAPDDPVEQSKLYMEQAGIQMPNHTEAMTAERLAEWRKQVEFFAQSAMSDCLHLTCAEIAEIFQYLDQQAAELAALKADFHIGQPVEVVDDYKYGEWCRVPLWIAGMTAANNTGHINYAVSESWPPDGKIGLTSGFRDTDLRARINPTDRGR